ncbi:hypothetical protein C2869_06895 [Saccharobesus litoralis]|uniref:Cyclic nucleotide-binding domain-containing protein n=1 Tax=Saccharobesus litoralis TaxID=2172099 RepID=A0A2S0VPQ4_9ALTE|nr:Crp/Fnr family transcriptional regulator [Saccharobesus litoralis]AWB66179.1 hypothetical protein C2869_06895 [Saccharobesus litoralis]
MEYLQQLLATQGQLIELKKKQHLFRQGELDAHFYYVRRGFLKAYYIAESGKSFVKSFIGENTSIACLSACYAEQACSYSLVAQENSSLIKLPFSLLLETSQTDIKFANEMQTLLIQLAIKKEKREHDFLCLPAEQRFIQLKQQWPDLFHKVPQHEIAQYLGVTDVGLSRIKTRLRA